MSHSNHRMTLTSEVIARCLLRQHPMVGESETTTGSTETMQCNRLRFTIPSTTSAWLHTVKSRIHCSPVQPHRLSLTLLIHSPPTHHDIKPGRGTMPPFIEPPAVDTTAEITVQLPCPAGAKSAARLPS